MKRRLLWGVGLVLLTGLVVLTLATWVGHRRLRKEVDVELRCVYVKRELTSLRFRSERLQMASRSWRVINDVTTLSEAAMKAQREGGSGSGYVQLLKRGLSALGTFASKDVVDNGPAIASCVDELEHLAIDVHNISSMGLKDLERVHKQLVPLVHACNRAFEQIATKATNDYGKARLELVGPPCSQVAFSFQEGTERRY